ncbi:MAG: hypothetical protein UY72_C0072G0009 [Candidatus Uhrbacteria bacterium GW2011_GWD2_52_7]|uniref:Uncharacterized protein n=1 Tax=Candidatus Uhrbacteria bacterium GW2011_GWD2_52_7 TaxID=1618989 RepID=A0A0G2A7Z9_9BACT|nr:MAG: hypothetical protein UY72_C0072G0009 [Candidatus Uhrbacteria bacterium GW2011_GWD2_52_7]
MVAHRTRWLLYFGNMRLRSSSDWTPTVCFGFAALLMLAIHWLIETPPGIERVMPWVFAGIAGVSAVKAAMGMKLPDGSTSYSWGDIGMAGELLFFAIGMLTFGGMGVASGLAGGEAWLISLVWGGIFLTYASWLAFRRRRTIFTTDGRMMVCFGKPFALYSRSWKTSDFSALLATTDWHYAGTLGMITSWRRAWHISAKGKRGNAYLYKCSSESDARELLVAFSKLTGIPASPLPHAKGSNESRSIAV